MIGGYNSDDPDGVAIAALADVPGGAVLYLTDAAWTGTRFKTNEGIRSLSIPGGGLPRGTVFGYGPDDFPQYSWSGVSGSFLLSSASDTVFVYCVGPDGTSPVHLAALSYSSQGWVPPDEDDSAFTTGVSALPDSMTECDCAVQLQHRDNAAYVGDRTGTREELLGKMSDPSRWSGSDSVRNHLPGVLSGFEVTPP